MAASSGKRGGKKPGAKPETAPRFALDDTPAPVPPPPAAPRGGAFAIVPPSAMNQLPSEPPAGRPVAVPPPPSAAPNSMPPQSLAPQSLPPQALMASGASLPSFASGPMTTSLQPGLVLPKEPIATIEPPPDAKPRRTQFAGMGEASGARRAIEEFKKSHRRALTQQRLRNIESAEKARLALFTKLAVFVVLAIALVIGGVKVLRLVRSIDHSKGVVTLKSLKKTVPAPGAAPGDSPSPSPSE